MFSKTFPGLCFGLPLAGGGDVSLFFLWTKDNLIFVCAFFVRGYSFSVAPNTMDSWGVWGSQNTSMVITQILRQGFLIDHRDMLSPKNTSVGKFTPKVYILLQKQREGSWSSQLLVHAKIHERNFFSGQPWGSWEKQEPCQHIRGTSA